MHTRFDILFKQLYVADEEKIQLINPNLDIPKLLSDVAINQSPTTPLVKIDKPTPIKLDTDSISQVTNNVLQDTDFNIVFDKMQNCTLCNLCDSRQNVVIERGTRLAKVMIVGDYPTHDDDISGVPFSANNGELLDKMIEAMKLDRTNEVYITNLMKCKPKANSQPTNDQINLCKEYLFSQIAHIKPIVIIVLGRLASQVLLNNQLSIKDMRSKINYYNNIPVIVSYSVDTINRAQFDQKQYFEYKKATWEDLQLAMQVMGKR